MKKTLLLTLALGLVGASSLVAANTDVYITGATAFRTSVYAASQKLFSPAPTIYYGDAAHGGADSGFSSGTASWVMTGTPITGLTNLSGNTLTIHGLFTGSVQGVQTVEDGTKLLFPAASGTPGGLCSAYVTNSPTIGFSDASSYATPFPAQGNIAEENVCVQPFVVVKSVPATGPVANISNVSWEQLAFGIPNGRLPYSAWTGNEADTNQYVYILERTLDSGTRRNFTAENYFQYSDPAKVYIYDVTNNTWFVPTLLTNTLTGSSPNGVVGPAGLNNVNLNWGYGYVGGGDIRSSLARNNAANQAIAFLSIADAKSLTVGGSNWATVVSISGFWPTAAGIGIRGNTGTNDFSPITSGYYTAYGNEILVHLIDPSAGAGDQNITQTQLGDQNTPGSFLGVFNAQSLYNGGTLVTGSIENEIELSKTGGATAIRLSDMRTSRPNVGGEIFPRVH
ncbi:MAG TPA: hypothetical protein VMB80_17875 [Candidatus Acidoferrum sp.]|nr:hypothetical protein [Candidatus Acidoferrum sp.]